MFVLKAVRQQRERERYRERERERLRERERERERGRERESEERQWERGMHTKVCLAFIDACLTKCTYHS